MEAVPGSLISRFFGLARGNAEETESRPEDSYANQSEEQGTEEMNEEDLLAAAGLERSPPSEVQQEAPTGEGGAGGESEEDSDDAWGEWQADGTKLHTEDKEDGDRARPEKSEGNQDWKSQNQPESSHKSDGSKVGSQASGSTRRRERKEYSSGKSGNIAGGSGAVKAKVKPTQLASQRSTNEKGRDRAANRQRNRSGVNNSNSNNNNKTSNDNHNNANGNGSRRRGTRGGRGASSSGPAQPPGHLRDIDIGFGPLGKGPGATTTAASASPGPRPGPGHGEEGGGAPPGNLTGSPIPQMPHPAATAAAASGWVHSHGHGHGWDAWAQQQPPPPGAWSPASAPFTFQAESWWGPLSGGTWPDQAAASAAPSAPPPLPTPAAVPYSSAAAAAPAESAAGRGPSVGASVGQQHHHHRHQTGGSRPSGHRSSTGEVVFETVSAALTRAEERMSKRCPSEDCKKLVADFVDTFELGKEMDIGLRLLAGSVVRRLIRDDHLRDKLKRRSDRVGAMLREITKVDAEVAGIVQALRRHAGLQEALASQRERHHHHHHRRHHGEHRSGHSASRRSRSRRRASSAADASKPPAARFSSSIRRSRSRHRSSNANSNINANSNNNSGGGRGSSRSGRGEDGEKVKAATSKAMPRPPSEHRRTRRRHEPGRESGRQEDRSRSRSRVRRRRSHRETAAATKSTKPGADTGTPGVPLEQSGVWGSGDDTLNEGGPGPSTSARVAPSATPSAAANFNSTYDDEHGDGQSDGYEEDDYHHDGAWDDSREETDAAAGAAANLGAGAASSTAATVSAPPLPAAPRVPRPSFRTFRAPTPTASSIYQTAYGQSSAQWGKEGGPQQQQQWEGEWGQEEHTAQEGGYAEEQPEQNESAVGPGSKEVQDWLHCLDAGRGLLTQYTEPLLREFGDLYTLASVVSTEVSTGSILGRIDASFWEALGVQALGHKMTLAKGLVELAKNQP